MFLKLSEKYNLPIRGNFEEHTRPTTTYFIAFDGVGMLEEKEQEEYLDILLIRLKKMIQQK